MQKKRKMKIEKFIAELEDYKNILINHNLYKKIKSVNFINECYKQRLILVQASGDKTIRLAPSLIIEDQEITEGFKRFEKAAKKIS